MLKTIMVVVASTLIGCATVTPGPSDIAASARQINPATDKVAVYFCRQWAPRGAAISLYPIIDGKVVGSLATKTFTRIELPVGEHEIALGYYDNNDSSFVKSMRREPVKMEIINGKGGDLHYYWIGVVGSSFFGGALTIDRFDNKAQASECLEDATYVSPR